MDRDIVCFHIPAFEIALARLNDIALRQRPVAVVSALAPRATVLDVSAEARDEGIAPGIAVQGAARVSPSVRFCVHDPQLVQQGQELLAHHVSQLTPVWEDVQPGHLLLDVTGTRRLFGPPIDTAMRLHRTMKHDYGLCGAAGVASNKFVSRVAASMVSPSQLCDVQAGAERPFVAPARLTDVPGLTDRHGCRALTTLLDLNVKTLGDLAAVPVPHLEVAIGSLSALLHAWATGIDHSKVWPTAERPSLAVAVPFEQDEIEWPPLVRAVHAAVEHQCRTLRREQRACRQVRLSLEYADHDRASGHARLPTPSHWEVDLFPVVRRLLDRSVVRRIRIRSGELRAEELVAPDCQLALYDRPESAHRQRRCRLSLTVDAIRHKFGADAVHWGALRPSAQQTWH